MSYGVDEKNSTLLPLSLRNYLYWEVLYRQGQADSTEMRAPRPLMDTRTNVSAANPIAYYLGYVRTSDKQLDELATAYHSKSMNNPYNLGYLNGSSDNPNLGFLYSKYRNGTRDRSEMFAGFEAGRFIHESEKFKKDAIHGMQSVTKFNELNFIINSTTNIFNIGEAYGRWMVYLGVESIQRKIAFTDGRSGRLKMHQNYGDLANIEDLFTFEDYMESYLLGERIRKLDQNYIVPLWYHLGWEDKANGLANKYFTRDIPNLPVMSNQDLIDYTRGFEEARS